MNIFKNISNKIQLTSENGLVICKEVNRTDYIGEQYYIREKADKLGAVAVLFRRKYNEHLEITDSKPVLHIYEKDNDFFNSEEHIKLHAQIWSAGDIDVYFIISSTRIDIFNARKPADIKDKQKQQLDLDKLCLVSEAIEQFNDQRFSGMVFTKGLFWEQEDFLNPDKDKFYKNQLEKEDAPFQQLLQHLMAVRKHLHKKQEDLSNATIDTLL